MACVTSKGAWLGSDASILSVCRVRVHAMVLVQVKIWGPKGMNRAGGWRDQMETSNLIVLLALLACAVRFLLIQLALILSPVCTHQCTSLSVTLASLVANEQVLSVCETDPCAV